MKSEDAVFPAKAIEKVGYGSIWKGQKTWNGVAILARDAEPIVVRRELPGDPEDKQSRYIEAAVKGVLIGCLYAPNGNPQPGPKFEYKLAWLERLRKHAAELHRLKVPAVLAGDYNVVPTEFDIYPNHSYGNDALLQPQSRALFRRIVAHGWTDAIRTLHPNEPMFTYWDYMRNSWPRNAGLRLDHLLLSGEAKARIRKLAWTAMCGASRGASDHAPAWVLLRDGGKPRPASVVGTVTRRSQSQAAPATGPSAGRCW